MKKYLEQMVCLEKETLALAKSNNAPGNVIGSIKKRLRSFEEELSEDELREEIRHKISAILIDTDEENQMLCEICIEDEEACGLGSLEMDWIDPCFQVPCEGTIWFHFDGDDGIFSGDRHCRNFDDLDTKDLEHILEGLQIKG